MPKLKKIHGRPLLPWWVYIGYFLLAATIVLWDSVAHGDDMKPATGKVAEKAKKGRKGDTRLAHINPFEEAILKALGGSGTTNPQTGYKEYFGGGSGGMGVGDVDPGYSGDQPGSYGGQIGTDTGGVSMDRVGSRTYDPDKESPFGIGGGNSTTWDPGPEATRGLLGLGPQSSVEGPKPPNTVEGFFQRNAHLAMLPTWATPFALGSQLLNDSRFGGKARADFPDGIGGASRDDAIMGALGAQPVAQPTPAAFAPPAEMTPPPALGLAGGLTDLQRRAQIATGGSQGQSGVYRTPEAMKYYGNLIARALIGNNGQAAQENSNILPVEQQYLRQVYGINQSDKAAALLDALKPYWSR